MVGQRARAGAVAGGSQDGIGQRLSGWTDRLMDETELLPN